PQSAPTVVTIDTQSPNAPSVPDLASSSDTGPSDTDDITSDTTPLFLVGGEAKSRVDLFATGKQVGSATSALTLHFVNSSALVDGVYQMTAKQTDVAGNESALSGIVLVTIETGVAPAAPSVPDLQAPSDTGASTADNITMDTTPTFAGDAEPGTTVNLFAD